MKHVQKDKMAALVMILLVVVFFSWIAWDTYVTTIRIKNPNINTEGEIVVIFYPNITVSEADSIINSTGGQILEHEYFYIEHYGECLHITVRVPVGEEDHYIELYKEKPEVYDAYINKVTAG